jgi:hypothetical protein
MACKYPRAVPEALWFVAPQRGLCRSDARRLKTVSRAVGAVVVSPALQRGVGETSNCSGVLEGRRHAPALPAILREE